MRQTVFVLLGGLAACAESGRGEGVSSDMTRDSADRAFHEVQQRGHLVMGVDQYTSYHRFEPLSDGGLITLERDSADRGGVAVIRDHMQKIAASFQAGDFAQPGFVHGREVPGTDVMRARRAQIRYIPQATPSGGRLRIVSRDSVALQAIHEFLAFQRHDHRVETHRSSP
ncbi:MAG TPA: hypothetical protein VHH32_12620 [Gemmatimonadales bacterium]|nr:hypothetical protein [Gemmatimonadales bacterium]